MLRRALPPFSIGIPLCAFALVGLTSLPISSAADDKPEKELPKTVTVDLGGDVKMEFVLIPKGKFTMGSPKDEKERNKDEDQHEVEITKPFYLAKYPVTQEQYLAIRGKNPSHFCKDGGDAGRVKDLETKQFPVDAVSWDDAQAFCRKLGENDKQKRKFRLPTEAEWEYACRAGTRTAFFFGDDPTKLGDFAWLEDNSGGRPHQVGEKNKPNAWGLHDMHGNVWQWCEDWYGPYEDLDKQDPVRKVKSGSGERRVLRGGSWDDDAGYCRAAYRFNDVPDDRYSHIGFRVAFRLD